MSTHKLYLKIKLLVIDTMCANPTIIARILYCSILCIAMNRNQVSSLIIAPFLCIGPIHIIITDNKFKLRFRRIRWWTLCWIHSRTDCRFQSRWTCRWICWWVYCRIWIIYLSESTTRNQQRNMKMLKNVQNAGNVGKCWESCEMLENAGKCWESFKILKSTLFC